MALIWGTSILGFINQAGTEPYTDIQNLPVDDQDRSKHVGIFTICV